MDSKEHSSVSFPRKRKFQFSLRRAFLVMTSWSVILGSFLQLKNTPDESLFFYGPLLLVRAQSNWESGVGFFLSVILALMISLAALSPNRMTAIISGAGLLAWLWLGTMIAAGAAC